MKKRRILIDPDGNSTVINLREKPPDPVEKSGPRISKKKYEKLQKKLDKVQKKLYKAVGKPVKKAWSEEARAAAAEARRTGAKARQERIKSGDQDKGAQHATGRGFKEDTEPHPAQFGDRYFDHKDGSHLTVREDGSWHHYDAGSGLVGKPAGEGEDSHSLGGYLSDRYGGKK